jgi:hypothetical protein
MALVEPVPVGFVLALIPGDSPCGKDRDAPLLAPFALFLFVTLVIVLGRGRQKRLKGP